MTRIDVASLAPFRGGRGGLRMGLSRLADSAWLDRGPDLGQRIAAKRAVFDQYPDALRTLPRAEAACAEVAALVGADGATLRDAALHVAEDLCVLQPEGDSHVLTAAALAFPTDWHLADKLGRPLDAIHAPIDGYAEKLAAGVAHFFHTLQPGPIFTRANWFVVETDALRYLVEGPAEARFAHVTADNAGDTLFVRCERQTLRRLPASGAVLFTIGIYIAPLGTLAPALARDLVAVIAGLPSGEARRRGIAAYTAALTGYMAGLRD